MKLADVFPAIIFLTDIDHLGDEPFTSLTFSGEKPPQTRRVDRCRVIVAFDKLFVVTDSPEGPTLVFREIVIDYYYDKTAKTHHIQTETGKVAVVGKDRNCGCGSRLRGWSLTKHIETV